MYYKQLTEMGFKYSGITEDLQVILIKAKLIDSSVLFFNWLLVKWQVLNFRGGKKLEPLCYSSISKLAKEYANRNRRTIRLMLKDLEDAKLIKLCKEGYKIKISIMPESLIKLYEKWGKNTPKSGH